MILFLDIVLVAIIGVVFPARNWMRYQRKIPPGPLLQYLLETILLLAMLISLLYKHGVSPQMIGIRAVFGLRFIINSVICTGIVVGLDIMSMQMAARQFKRQQSTLQIASVETLGVYTDALHGGHDLKSFIPVVIVGAIWEELCFRGAVLLLIPKTSIGLLCMGVIGGSLVFGSQHLRNGPTAVIYSTFYGVLFSCLYLATNDLIAVMIAHAAGNMFAALYGAPKLARIRNETVAKMSMFVG